MKRRGLVVLALALIFASVAVFLARSWVQDQVGLAADAGQSAVPLTTVVVAGTRLDFGNTIRREHLRVVDWPVSSVPPDTFTTIEEILDAKDDQEGTGSQERVVLLRIEQNEPIYRSKVSGFGGRASLSTKIDDEMRALTIRVNDVLGVAGFVLPGDRVDILLTRSVNGNSRSNKKNLINTVLLEEVKVLGIDQEAGNDKDKPTVVKAVTLEVTSKQAQKLTLAAQVGTLTLALRGTTTVDSAKGRTINVSDLYIGESNATVPEPVAVVEPPKPVKPAKPAAHSTPVAAAPPPPKPTPKPDKFTTVNILRGLDSSKTKVLAETAGEQQFGQTTSIPIVPSMTPSPSQAPAVGVSPEAVPTPNGSVIDLLRNTPFSGIGEGNPILAPGTIAPAVSPEDPGV